MSAGDIPDMGRIKQGTDYTAMHELGKNMEYSAADIPAFPGEP
ncbi:unnamed protein product, partial [marine sediment metagenome]